MTTIELQSSSDDWGELLFLVAAIVAGFAASYWRSFAQLLQVWRGSKWPTISATVDIVTVIEQIHNGEGENYTDYLATLTYFYKNPDLQCGEYSRVFSMRGDAQRWADSYNGDTVTVHVDPSDPSNSVWHEG